MLKNTVDVFACGAPFKTQERVATPNRSNDPLLARISLQAGRIPPFTRVVVGWEHTLGPRCRDLGI